MTNYEQSRPVLVNMRVTRAWRDRTHETAKQRGMTLSAYLKHLVEKDSEQS
jgi:predicted DNA binding CopG/RHH family protein